MGVGGNEQGVAGRVHADRREASAGRGLDTRPDDDAGTAGAGILSRGPYEHFRAAGWMLGVLGALAGLLGPLLARDWDGTAFVGVAGGSAACVLGAVIVDRRPVNKAAWGFLAGGLLLVAFALCYSWAAGEIRAAGEAAAYDPAALGPEVGAVAAVGAVFGVLAGGSLPLFLFFFPDGALPSRRWRAVFAAYLAAWLGGAAVAAVALWPHRLPAIAAWNGSVDLPVPDELDGPLEVVGLTEVFAAVAMAAGVAAVAVRLRRARGHQRSQVLLGLWGFGLTATLIAATGALDGAGHGTASEVTALSAPLPLMLAVTVAMRRHRLFDVDRLVGRTLTYAAVTALLVGVFAVVVLVTGALAGRLAFGSSWPVAAATLAVATAARPLLRFVQGVVDRRFDRRTWLAVRTIDAFTLDLRQGTAAPADLLAALRRALDDTTASVVYLDGAATIDLSGNPVPLAQPGPGRRRREVRAGGAPVAVVEMDERLGQEPRLVAAALSAAALPLENAALHARTAVRLAEVAASRNRIVEADDSNLRRIERDLHDGAQQRLVALALRLRIAERQVPAHNQAVSQVFADAVRELLAAVDELRELTRSILPPVIAEEGLPVALRTAAARLPLPVTVDATDERLPRTVEATAWFVACEGMANAVKHAHPATLRVSVRKLGETVRVEVEDDGVGGAVVVPGGGLEGLIDRVAAIGGTMHIVGPPAGGTLLRIELPCG